MLLNDLSLYWSPDETVSFPIMLKNCWQFNFIHLLQKRLSIILILLHFCKYFHIKKSITRSLVTLNTMTENENTSFANISIYFLRSCSQYAVLYTMLPKLRYLNIFTLYLMEQRHLLFTLLPQLSQSLSWALD